MLVAIGVFFHTGMAYKAWERKDRRRGRDREGGEGSVGGGERGRGWEGEGSKER